MYMFIMIYNYFINIFVKLYSDIYQITSSINYFILQSYLFPFFLISETWRSLLSDIDMINLKSLGIFLCNYVIWLLAFTYPNKYEKSADGSTRSSTPGEYIITPF